MNVYQKLMMNREGLTKHGPINIVIFGDSISHGAFNGYIDFESVYWNVLRKKLNALRTYIPVNMICAAIGGTTAKKSLSRLEGQVLSLHPDLVIVCFGLNDVNGPLEDYLGALETIFAECTACGADVIFMTPNMMNTYVAEDTPAEHLEYAYKTAKMQNEGKVDMYIEAAKALACRMGIAVCDCYAKWKALYSSGIDTTQLLCNRINHPTEEMHNLFADALFELITAQNTENAAADDTMFQQK